MKTFISNCFLLLSIIICYGQKENPFFKGKIEHYSNQPLSLFKCYGDTLLFADSTRTGKNGEFAFSDTKLHSWTGMLKVVLKGNKFLYILNNKSQIEIKTVYQPNDMFNILIDSLKVLQSEENKKFYEFQQKQQQINIGNYWLLQMMRLYPLHDPFHKPIEEEFFSRYKEMEQYVKKLSVNNKKNNVQILSKKVALAYYQPINPDWKQPDPWRDSIIALHYFDYFNPADSFYMYTNILSEKIDIYFQLITNKRDAFGQPRHDEKLYTQAAEEFLEKSKSNQKNFEFCLQYIMKRFKKDHMETGFLHLYELYLKPEEGDCETENKQFEWSREIANKLRNVSIGSIAPDFGVNDNIQLSNMQSNYTLLIFWASWCPHCTMDVPEIKKVIDEYNQKSEKKLLAIAVSLDTDKEQWQKFISDNQLTSFLNFSELKGWKSEVVKKYNVYATPSMFLLDKDKKIIAKPKTVIELKDNLL